MAGEGHGYGLSKADSCGSSRPTWGDQNGQRPAFPGDKVEQEWKAARVILLRKPGKDPSLPNAYRPISILPAMSKIWEKCFKKIIERCIGTDPFHRRQYGFRKKN